jgi:hypothetical protein
MGGFERYLWHLYHPDGNVSRLTHSDGAVFSFHYDGLGRMTYLVERPSIVHMDDYVSRYWYRPEGPRYAAVRGIGPAGFTTVYYYDTVQRLYVTANLPVPANSLRIEQHYNPASQIRQSGRVAVERPYSVNGQNQYITAASRRSIAATEAAPAA